MSLEGVGKIYWHLLANDFNGTTRVRFNVNYGLVNRLASQLCSHSQLSNQCAKCKKVTQRQIPWHKGSPRRTLLTIPWRSSTVRQRFVLALARAYPRRRQRHTVIVSSKDWREKRGISVRNGLKLFRMAKWWRQQQFSISFRKLIRSFLKVSQVSLLYCM